MALSWHANYCAARSFCLPSVLKLSPPEYFSFHHLNYFKRALYWFPVVAVTNCHTLIVFNLAVTHLEAEVQSELFCVKCLQGWGTFGDLRCFQVLAVTSLFLDRICEGSSPVLPLLASGDCEQFLACELIIPTPPSSDPMFTSSVCALAHLSFKEY